ncbi:MAG: hypothetical protein DRI01_10620, partial [Chloroflexi bacterium]
HHVVVPNVGATNALIAKLKARGILPSDFEPEPFRDRLVRFRDASVGRVRELLNVALEYWDVGSPELVKHAIERAAEIELEGPEEKSRLQELVEEVEYEFCL